MDSCERFDETSLPQKFKLKNLVDYHDLYVQSDTLLLTDEYLRILETSVLKYMN